MISPDSTTCAILVVTIVSQLVQLPEALLCRQCISQFGWEDCDRAARDNLCTPQGVSASHSTWLQENPSLPLGNHTRFSCFKYVALVNRHNDKGLATVYSRGCTFAVGDFCSGWKPSVAVKSCNVCSDREMCNGGNARWDSLTLIGTRSLLVVVICVLIYR